MWISDRAIFEDMVKMIERSGVGLGEERAERRVGEEEVRVGEKEVERRVWEQEVGGQEEVLSEALEKTGGGLGLGCWARYGVCLTR